MYDHIPDYLTNEDGLIEDVVNTTVAIDEPSGRNGFDVDEDQPAHAAANVIDGKTSAGLVAVDATVMEGDTGVTNTSMSADSTDSGAAIRYRPFNTNSIF